MYYRFLKTEYLEPGDITYNNKGPLTGKFHGEYNER